MALCVVLFKLKPLNEDGNLQVFMYCMHAKRSLRTPPEHTSEHVKSQNCLVASPQTPSHTLCYGPHVLYLPWAPSILLAALGRALVSGLLWVCQARSRACIFVLGFKVHMKVTGSAKQLVDIFLSG